MTGRSGFRFDRQHRLSARIFDLCIHRNEAAGRSYPGGFVGGWITSTLNYTTPSSVPYGLIQIVLGAPNNQVNFDNVRLRSTNITTKPAESYAYDANGNRLTSSSVSTSADGTHNRQQSDGTHNFTYDNEGNRISRTQISNGYFTQYVWDYRNRLTQVVKRSSAASATPLKNV